MNILAMPAKAGLNKWLKAMILALAFLAMVWLLAVPVRAETGLTVEVNRSHNLLIATAVTVEGSEIVDDSWQWTKNEQCDLDLFASDVDIDGESRGESWTVVLNSDDADESYCFYVEDSGGRKAVASATVMRPTIEIDQNNDQLVARVADAEQMGLIIDQNSWRWYRYHNVENSGFDCRAELFGLEDAELQQEAERLQSAQEASADETQPDIYEIQKNVYLFGRDSSVDLTVDDAGMNFCFQVSDTAGISNVMHITVGEVIVDDIVGKPVDVGITNVNESGVVDAGQTEAGQITVGDGSVNVGEDSSVGSEETDSNSNLIRNIGFVLLGLAAVIGIYMLIKRSQNTDDEEA